MYLSCDKVFTDTSELRMSAIDYELAALLFFKTQLFFT